MADFNPKEVFNKLKKNPLFVPAILVGGGLGVFMLLRNGQNPISNTGGIGNNPLGNNPDYTGDGIIPDIGNDLPSGIDNPDDSEFPPIPTPDITDFIDQVTDWINQPVESIIPSGEFFPTESYYPVSTTDIFGGSSDTYGGLSGFEDTSYNPFTPTTVKKITTETRTTKVVKPITGLTPSIKGIQPMVNPKVSLPKITVPKITIPKPSIKPVFSLPKPTISKPTFTGYKPTFSKPSYGTPKPTFSKPYSPYKPTTKKPMGK